MGDGRFSRLYDVLNELSEEFLWSDWLEWWEENAVSLCIVFVLVSGLGSCVFFVGKAAITGGDAAPAVERTEPARNPWSVDRRETTHQPR